MGRKNEMGHTAADLAESEDRPELARHLIQLAASRAEAAEIDASAREAKASSTKRLGI